jgi:hypothetical protein
LPIPGSMMVPNAVNNLHPTGGHWRVSVNYKLKFKFSGPIYVILSVLEVGWMNARCHSISLSLDWDHTLLTILPQL